MTLDTHGHPQLPENLAVPAEPGDAPVITVDPGAALDGPTRPVLRETITIGPVGVFFCNTNTAMKLKGHCHTGALWITFRTLGSGTGYPSFKATNDPLREHVKALTSKPFRDSTNEDVLRQLWDGLEAFRAPEWEPWGGAFQLHALRLDVIGVDDKIGHDPGATVYTIERPW